MKFTVSVEVEASSGEEACAKVLGWTPQHVSEASVRRGDGEPKIYVTGRSGYEGFQPAWIKTRRKGTR